MRVCCARYAGSPLDLAIRTLTLLGNSVPIFWLGLLMLALFYAKPVERWPGRLDDIWQFTVEPRTGFALVDTWLSGDRGSVPQRHQPWCCRCCCWPTTRWQVSPADALAC
ncbi:MAG: hypothetical protein ACLTXH_12485 [Enterobacter hormaechei]